MLQAALPAIQSVRNAASNLAGPIAPQMIVAIYGTDLATSTASAAALPLPPALGGASVTFHGTRAPLFYASPSQINAQVPSGIKSGGVANIVVTTALGQSQAAVVPVQGRALGIFTQDASGCGQAAALNIHADGTLSLNTPQNSLDSSSDLGLALYMTGLGAFVDRADGYAAVFNPQDQSLVSSYLQVAPYMNIDVLPPSYAGPAPGLVGVDQVNALLLGQEPLEGCRVPLALASIPYASQYVNVSTHKGGGACVDPPADSLGLITWSRNVISDISSASASEGLSIQFLKKPGIIFPEILRVGSGHYGVPAQEPSFCPASATPTLDAGPLIATGPGTSITLNPQTSGGQVSYEAQLPAGSIGGGSYTVTAAANAAVGAFSAQAQLPPPIAIVNDLRPGTVLSGSFLKLNWTGGDSRSAVTVQYLVRSGGELVYSVVNTVSGADGQVFANLHFPGSGFSNPIPVGDVEIIVTQQPVANPAQPFTASGLTLGGTQNWNYVFDFRGLKNVF